MDKARKKLYNRKYYLKNKEILKKKMKEYFYKNLDKFKLYRAKYIKSNKGKLSLRIRSKRYRSKNAMKCFARDSLNNALKSGLIIKQSCQRCGNQKSQAHHENYSKPLHVSWFCEICHKFIENRLLNTSELAKPLDGWAR